MGNNPVRQHTVPCSYLRWFSNNPYQGNNGRDSIIYVYDVKTEKGGYRTVDSATIEKDIYTLTDRNGNKSYVVEDFLGKEIENIGHIIEKIDKKEILEWGEMEKLAMFITFQEMRSKSRMESDNYSDKRFLSHILHSCFEHCDNKKDLEQAITNSLDVYFPNCELGCSIQDVIEKYDKGDEIPLDTKKKSIKNMIELAPQMVTFLINRPWLIMHACGDNSFITSDYPLYLDGERNAISSPGYGTADHIEIALSKKSYLIMYSPYDKALKFHGKEPHLVKNLYQDVVDPHFIRVLNYATAYATNRWLMGNDKALVESIHKSVKKMDEAYKKKQDLSTGNRVSKLQNLF